MFNTVSATVKTIEHCYNLCQIYTKRRIFLLFFLLFLTFAIEKRKKKAVGAQDVHFAPAQ